MVKNLSFGQKSQFWSKSQSWTKIIGLKSQRWSKKPNFGLTILIVVKKIHFWVKSTDFDETSKFPSKIEIYVEYFTLSFFRIYVGLISAFGEMKIIELAGNCFSLPVAESCFHLVIFSWYQFYSASRALNNPIEVTLFSISFYELQKAGLQSSSTKYLIFAGASIFIRSSGIACYIGLFLFHFYHCKGPFLTTTVGYA